jgi:UPF0755 protein
MMAPREVEPTPRERDERERVKRSPSRAGGVAAFALVIGVLIVVVLAVSVWGFILRPWSDVEPGSPVQIEIAEGTTTNEIATKLADTGVVTNPNMFRIQTRMAGADGELKAGVYDFVTGMPTSDVIDRMRQGPAIRYATVTIPEGYVIEQIAARFEEQAGIPADEFVALANGGTDEFPDREYLSYAYNGSLEGYLFPKTYRVKEGSTARDVIEMMLDQFEEEVAQVDLTQAQQRGMTLHEVVTIASMIEREAAVSEERTLISSVIHNRLRDGMRLEIDATIEYVLPGNRFRLKNSDLQVDSPFNTYRNGGLPPGPISNPGLASLQAAAAPDETEYLYYVLTGKDGSHTFATNSEEFLKAKKLSKEVFGK